MSMSNKTKYNVALILNVIVFFLIGMGAERYYQGDITVYTNCDIIYVNTFTKTISTESGLTRKVGGARGAKEILENLTVACVNDEYDQVLHYLMNYGS